MPLVLTRKKGEAVRINDTITVTVVELQPGKVRLLFDAPPSVRILRDEIYDEVTAATAADTPNPQQENPQ